MITALPDECLRQLHDGVRSYTLPERGRLLARMGVAVAPPSLAALTQLQWAMLRTSPFHNIELLAARVGHRAPLEPEACLERVLCGEGGPCHVQATGFLALLRSLGYTAHLAAATILSPGDHLVVVARIDGQAFLCDVGNGHPYIRPLPLHEASAFERFGWRFTTAVDAHGLTLTRWLGGESSKIVYRVDPRPRAFADFADIVRRHHQQQGFGPFLGGLRAVRICEHVMLTLRGTEYQRHTRHRSTIRRIDDERGLIALLRGPFGLDTLPLEAAVEALRRNGIEPTTRAAGDVRSSGPDRARILVSLSTTDRPDALACLTDGLIAELARTGYAGWPARRATSLLVVENSRLAANRACNRQIIARSMAQGLPVELVDDGHHDRSIGESRRRQVQAIAARQRRGLGADAWWMIDDDSAFAQLRLGPEGRLLKVQEIDYLGTIDRYLRERPEVSVVLGGVTGDPPIRPEAVLRGQLFDVLANLEWFASLAPDTPYRADAQAAGYRIADYYYDHRQGGDEHLSSPFLWLPRGPAPGRVVEELVAFLTEVRGIAWGRSVTRPLLLGTAAIPDQERTGCRRGGNTVFLDWDALLAHAYPTFQVGDVWTRRSDMIGTALLAAGGGTTVVEAPMPLLHQRVVLPVVPTRSEALHSLLAEFFGVIAARTVMNGSPATNDSGEALASLASERAAMVVERLAGAGRLVDRVLCRLDERHGAWWERHELTAAPIASLRDILLQLADGILGGRTEQERRTWLRYVEAELRSPSRIDALVAGISSIGEQIAAHRQDTARWLDGGDA